MLANRISKLDGLRAICCLGVLWIHCWHLNGSVSIDVFGFNLAKPLSVLGNGVDFFFAISGFCMYYFYLNKLNAVTLKTYTDFIVKRAKRIIPVYYLFVIVCVFVLLISKPDIPIFKPLIANLFFLQIFSTSFEIFSHLWSIAVEWHFYLIFPLILIFKNSKNFLAYIVLLTIIMLGIGFVLLNISNEFDYYLPVRFVEFSTGIIAGYFLKLKRSESSLTILLIGIIILFIGRLLITDIVLSAYQNRVYYSICKLVGYTLLSGGFSVVLYCILLSNRIIYSFLDNVYLVFIGKISYSFYLWHGITCFLVWRLLIANLNLDAVYITFIHFGLSIFVTMPIAYLSYKYVEQKFN